MQPPIIRYAQLASLVIALTTLFLFFASGMYSERILAANRFVPQANRALRSFNMYLNTRKPPKTNRLAKYLPGLLRGDGESAGSTTPLTGKSMDGPSPLPGTAAATRLVRSSPDPSDPSSPAPLRRMQIPPIPPSTNPRGEIIFSNKVAGPFREGYERYRNAFERRRKEKLQLQEEEARWRIVKWIRRRTRDSKFAGGEGGMEAGLMTPTPRAKEKMGTPSGLPTPGEARRSSRPSSVYSETSAAAGQTAGPIRSPMPHRSSGNRGRADSSASMASNASQTSEGSSSGGHGGERKRRASPRRRAREGTPGGSTGGSGGSGLRNSLDGADVEETPKKSSPKQKPTMPDATKVAAAADERLDPEATLREPSGDAEPPPVARKTRSSTRLRDDEEQAGNASTSSSRDVSDAESAEDGGKTLQESRLEISMVSLHDSTLDLDKKEQQRGSGKPESEDSTTLYPPSSAKSRQEEGAGGWIEVKRTASHLRRAKESS